jgi:hypothetical protein
MTVYFDKQNLEAFLQSGSRPGFEDALRMVNTELNVALNFTAQEMQNPGPTRDLLSKFLGRMVIGRKNLKFSFLPTAYPKRPILVDFYAQPEAFRRSVVLADDVELAACKAAGTSMVGLVGEELPALSSLHRDDKYKFLTTLTIGRDKGQFSAWSQLSPHILPFHDLIIHDRYLLDSRELFEHNYRGILQALTQNRHGKLNVVLLTMLPKDAEVVDEFEWLRELTSEILVSTTGTEPNLTVVWGERTADVRHDRHIITNYQWLSSGDSLLYFWPSGQLRSHGDTLTVHSLADLETRTHVDELLKRMQSNVGELRPLAGMIQGDRVSSFLNF